MYGYGSNIFSILSDAKKTLKAENNAEYIDEMVERVDKAQDYDEAIYIIEEYIGDVVL